MGRRAGGSAESRGETKRFVCFEEEGQKGKAVDNGSIVAGWGVWCWNGEWVAVEVCGWVVCEVGRERDS